MIKIKKQTKKKKKNDVVVFYSLTSTFLYVEVLRSYQTMITPMFRLSRAQRNQESIAQSHDTARMPVLRFRLDDK